MRKIMLIALPYILSACSALNHGFPKDVGVGGKLRPINSKEVTENVK